MDERRRGRRRSIVPVVILTVVILAAAGFFFAKFFFEIKTVTIKGSNKYSYQQLYNYVFEHRNDKNMIMFMVDDRKAPKIDIPFIAKTEIEVKLPSTINITVYEKSLMFYVEYKGTYMYVDKDGVVVQSSSELVDDVMLVEGLNFNTIVINEPLKVEDKSVFSDVTDIIQYMKKNEVQANRILVEDSGYSIILDNVKVLLGENNIYMAERIFELSCMVDKLEGLSGILYLDSYEGNSSSIIFKQD